MCLRQWYSELSVISDQARRIDLPGLIFICLYCSHLLTTINTILSSHSMFRPLLRRTSRVYLTVAEIVEEPRTIDRSWYPPLATTRANPVIRISQFRHRFSSEDFAQYQNKRHPDTLHVEGRITSIRKLGKLMYFIDVIQDGTKLQVVATNKLMGLDRTQFEALHEILKTGDSIGVLGQAGRTNTGELSLKALAPVVMLSPAERIPNKLVDRGTINANRALYYRVNPALKHPIAVKSALTKVFRQFFDDRGFLEVHTPMLSGPATGANARSFITTDIHGKQLLLRVAPELWLKKLVIGGFDKVYEIGTNFRNEGVDATHNPEFTLCEFYQAYTQLEELMDITERLFANCQKKLLVKGLEPLTEKFFRLEFIPGIENATGKSLPEFTSSALRQYCQEVGVAIKGDSPAQLLDALSSHYLEPISSLPENRNRPVFIYNQPEVMSPLAKASTVSYGGREYVVSRRFELFINGKEYVNAYEEENDPVEQHRKFSQQQQFKSDGDDELLVPDWRYVEQMEYGLPPTGGWGCGVDRLAMLFSGLERIELVNTFGTIDDVLKQ